MGLTARSLWQPLGGQRAGMALFHPLESPRTGPRDVNDAMSGAALWNPLPTSPPSTGGKACSRRGPLFQPEHRSRRPQARTPPRPSALRDEGGKPGISFQELSLRTRGRDQLRQTMRLGQTPCAAHSEPRVYWGPSRGTTWLPPRITPNRSASRGKGPKRTPFQPGHDSPCRLLEAQDEGIKRLPSLDHLHLQAPSLGVLPQTFL